MIDLDSVRVTRGAQAVLDGVSLSVEEGRFVGLVGPNGAGKTTLLQTITGVLTPAHGTVTVGGLSVPTASAREISRQVATVPQHETTEFALSVGDIVEMGRTPYASRFSRRDYREDERHVERALARTETTEFADRRLGDLSGGERQRVMLARALAQDTPVLLLDEPTASLDITHQIRSLSLVADLVAEGKTALAAIHDLDLAARFCDRLVLLVDGSIVTSGSPETVLDSRFLDGAFDTETAVATDPVTGTPAVTAMIEREARSRQVHVVASGPVGADVLARLHDAGLTVTAGPVPSGDVTAETARSRGLDLLTCEPFSPLDTEAQHRLSDRIAAADVTVVADPPLDGAGTIVDELEEATSLVVVETATDEGATATLRRRAEPTDLAGVTGTVLRAIPDPELPADG